MPSPFSNLNSSSPNSTQTFLLLVQATPAICKANMSKRRRLDYEAGIQNANGTAYDSTTAAGANHEMSYDDVPSTNPAPKPHPGNNVSTAPEARDQNVATSEVPQSRKQVSYVEEAPEPAPAGPYSYTTEKRQQIYYSGRETDDNRHWKRPRAEQRKHRPQMNERFGQMGAFPEPEGGGVEEDDGEGGLDGGQEEDGGGGREAWEYLKRVREEADGLPGVFNAGDGTRDGGGDSIAGEVGEGEAEEIYNEEDEGDVNGHWREDEEDYTQEDDLYFEDGVCWAAPRSASPEKALTAQDLYYKALCRRFEKHRDAIRALKPGAQTGQKGSKNGKYGNAPTLKFVGHLFQKKSYRHGRPSLVGFAPPTLELISSLDTAGVLRILTVLDEDIDEFIAKGENLPPSLGAWTWLLLGRLDDAGGLTSEEVGTVRDLAKRAGWALAALKIAVLQRESAANDDGGMDGQTTGSKGTMHEPTHNDLEDGELEDEDTAPSSAKAAQGSKAATSSKEPVPNESTLATLHLIITVAGEFYGQRDLLDSRLPWID